MVRSLVLLFVLSWTALLSWFAYFSFRPDAAPEHVGGVTSALILTALLSGACSFSSVLLAYHYRREEYGAGEAVIFGASLVVSAGVFVCSGVWAIAAIVFG